MTREKLGTILFYSFFEPDIREITEKEKEEVLNFLGFETFVDCNPFGYLGMKDTQSGKILEDCYAD